MKEVNNMEDKFTYVGRMYDWYEVKEDYLRVLFQVYDKGTKSFYFYELQVYEPELISKFINLKPKQVIGVEGHFDELISHPDRGLSHIELEHVVDKIITSE